MLYAVTKENGSFNAAIYDNFEQFHKATFSPEIEVDAIITFKAHGKTYAEKKESIREQAVIFSYAMMYGCVWDNTTASAEFERVGRRYGLLEEFKENAII